MEGDKSQVKYFVTLSSGWDGFPIAFHLQEEGNKSFIGQVQSKGELGIGEDKEEPEEKKARLAQYEGMLKKHKAKTLIEALKRVENKDDYFIFCDQNNLFSYAQELQEAGFTKGLFPTKEDFELEKNREEAMKFVEEYYPNVSIIPHERYKTVEEAMKAVEEAEVPLVLQSEGDYVSTIVPPDDVEQNHAEILSELERNKDKFSKGQIILKEKLIQPIEVTPQIVFWDGEPVFTDIDIETKNIGDGENNGSQVGCATNLIVRTELSDAINELAFPPKVHEMAKERKGLFVWDISLYFTENGIFFGEFCSNRFGYDALMTEVMMSGGATAYFNRLMNGENPLREHFGAAVRVFNLNRSGDVQIKVENASATWLFEVQKQADSLLSISNGWDLGVITGCGDSIENAVNDVYKNLDSLSFKEKYTRTKDDFLADYPTSILHRYKALNHQLFEAPDLEPSVEEQFSEFRQKTKEKLYGLINED